MRGARKKPLAEVRLNARRKDPVEVPTSEV